LEWSFLEHIAAMEMIRLLLTFLYFRDNHSTVKFVALYCSLVSDTTVTQSVSHDFLSAGELFFHMYKLTLVAFSQIIKREMMIRTVSVCTQLGEGQSFRFSSGAVNASTPAAVSDELMETVITIPL
jgi:hypothetical protein